MVENFILASLHCSFSQLGCFKSQSWTKIDPASLAVQPKQKTKTKNQQRAVAIAWREMASVSLKRVQCVESPGPREAGAVSQPSPPGIVPRRSPMHWPDTPTTWLTWGPQGPILHRWGKLRTGRLDS